MGRASRDKGLRAERNIVALFHDEGIPAERVPLSGQQGGRFAGDVVIGDDWRAEVKARKSGEGFTVLERWLAGHDLLLLVRDRKAPMAVMEWGMLVALMRAYKGDTICTNGQE